MLEKQIEAAVAKAARLEGWYCWKLASPSLRGVPDRMFFKQGRMVFIEFKTPKGVVSALQMEMLNLLRREGFEAHVAYTVQEGLNILGIGREI